MDNVQKLIDAGVLNVTNRNQLPQDLVDKVNALTAEQIDLLTQMKNKLGPDLMKSYTEFIWS